MRLLSYNIEAYIPYDEDSIEEILALCEDAINNIVDEEKANFRLKSTIHELLINSLEHGYKKSAGKVSLSIRRENNLVFFEICDEGSGLDLSSINLEQKLSDTETPTSRGWGLVIANKFSDNMKIIPNKPTGTKVCLTISLC